MSTAEAWTNEADDTDEMDLGAFDYGWGPPEPTPQIRPVAPRARGAQENLYAAPSYDVVERFDALATAKDATRVERLGGALIDTLVAMVGAIPLTVAFWPGASAGPNSQSVLLGASIVYFLGVFGLNLYWMAVHAQSIGKRAMGTKIVRNDYSEQASLGRIFWIRGVAMNMICNIPVVGGFIALLNYLWIFGEEKRCLHDLLADTRVVQANTFN